MIPRALRAFAWAVGLVLALRPASAGTAWEGRRPTILTLIVNDVAHGESLVLIAGGDALVVDEDLKRAGIRIGGAVTETVRGRRFVSLRSLGIRFVAGELDMEIRLTVSPDLLPRTSVDLAPPGAPPGIEHRDQASSYLSYALHADARTDADEPAPRFDAYTEAGVRLAGALLETSFAVTPGAGPVRGASTVRWDDRDDLRSLVLGDQLAGGGALGSRVAIGGVHLVRAFELDPYLPTVPTLDLEGSVMAPSTADVYVDGALVQRIELPPGAYDLRNIPVATGAGTTRIVLRDRLGRMQELGSRFYMPAGLLRRGLSDYGLSVGFRRDDLARASFDYGPPVAIARYRRGLAARLTAGLHAEGSPELAAGGAEVIAGTPIGQLAVDVAVSGTREGGRGAAVALGWAYQGQRGGVSLGLRAATAEHATLTPPDDDDIVREATLGVDRALGRRLTVALQARALERRDGARSASASASAQLALTRDQALSFHAGAISDERTGTAWQALASLSFGLGDRTRGSVSHEHAGAAARDRFDVHRTIGRDSGVGYRLTAESGARDQVRAELELKTRHGRYQAGYLYGPDGGRAEASVSGGLVAVGDRSFATPPVDRGFVLVRVPAVKGVRVYLENKLVGRTDARGELLVPGVLSHYGNRISIEPGDLPDDRPPTRTSALLAPPRRGGVALTFLAPLLRMVRGRLEIEHAGRRIVPAYGELVIGEPASFDNPESDEWRSPIGGDGAFEIEGLGAGSYPAVIVWDGGRCKLSLTVPAATAPITRLGPQVCTEVRP